ncbi:pilus assembly protein [Diaphorobacter aerolatus]|uniref:Pilus assembly protein PilY n=1 Tax=Diaphorobacter aerolatus TaxID=1288495 RepID=A0A7H0GFS8_9BURK|nr:PilC/PilY family type IV pilus protein [Diaphorobacter aerolatus]QNP47144.1 pilus assembly protein PilY [Diaphorobacter aerolatus]
MLLTMAVCAPPAFAALTINDPLNGASSSQWYAVDGACLTAGNGSGLIPRCVGLSYYSGKTHVGGAKPGGRLPDDVGSGALRLTNGDVQMEGVNGNNQRGAVFSRQTLPSDEGLRVTFTSYTYGGNAYNGWVNNVGHTYSKDGNGADGLSFFLIDGDQVQQLIGELSATKLPGLGATGASLGYGCSSDADNIPADPGGLVGGFIGLGIDEFGNFNASNKVGNTGEAPKPNNVVLRGRGNVNWTYLNANAQTKPAFPNAMPPTAKRTALKDACTKGTVSAGGKLISVPNNRWLGSSVVPAKIANQQGIAAPRRTDANAITYDLRLSRKGEISLAYSVKGGNFVDVVRDKSILAADETLPSKFYFGFAASTGTGSNVHEISCFRAEQLSASTTTSSANTDPSTKLETGDQVFFSYFHTENWWGEFIAKNMVYNPATDRVSVAPMANWNASCVLTGGVCASTGGALVTAQSPAQRNLMTWNGAAGIPLRWDRLGDAQQKALSLSNVVPGAAQDASRLNYLAGDRTYETQATSTHQTYRKRTGVLGDIQSSNPAWVGPPNQSYRQVWVDALYPDAAMPEGDTSYSAFAASKASRTNVVYVGANDGFLHGFRAGAYRGGKFDPLSANDGRELIAYMPGAALASFGVSSVTDPANFSDEKYAHNAYVDGSPGTGDLYYRGAWHTWLAGGLGNGGNKGGVIGNLTDTAQGAFYVLDVTDPSAFSSSDASAEAVVVGDWTSSTITCIGDTQCGKHLGSVSGKPIVRRLHNGHWAVLFGNGRNSASGKAGIFVMTVDSASGATSFRYLDSGAAAPAAGVGKNGIIELTSADLDGDKVTDYVYAGDLKGNLWRFDLSSSNAADWKADSKPLAATGLPISTQPTVSRVKQPGIASPRLIINFGTGLLLPATTSGGAVPAAGAQYLYGLWDWNLEAWNARSTTAYASLPASRNTTGEGLQTQTLNAVTVIGSGYTTQGRTVSSNPVCWVGSNRCESTANNHVGWRIALPGTTTSSDKGTWYEQVIYNPTLNDGMLTLNTIIPGNSAIDPATCTAGETTGFLLTLNPDTGSLDRPYITDGTTATGAPLAALMLNQVGSVNRQETPGGPVIWSGARDGEQKFTRIQPSISGGGRLTWIQLR